MTLLLEVGALLVLVVLNGLLAMSETAVVSARQSRLEQRASAGDDRARAAAALKDEPTAFLSSVQIGITLIGIVAGAFGGARLSRRAAPHLAELGWFGDHVDTVALVLVVALTTYLSLVFGELVPKRIALADPEGVAARVAGPMRMLARVTRPVVALLTASTNGVARLIGVRRRSEAVTEGDIRALIDQGARAGVVHAVEEGLLERVFYLGDRPAHAVMTPRPEVRWVTPSTSRAELQRAAGATHDGRFLVCDDSLDAVLGVVRAEELLAHCIGGGEPDLRALLRALLRQPHRVPASMPLLDLLRRFHGSDVHLAVVMDEADRVAGVVTLEDILLDLVADVPGVEGEGDGGRRVVRRDDGSWLLDGALTVARVEQALGGKLLPLSERRANRTLASLARERLESPAEGAVFRLGAFELEVMDMDGPRVDRVLARERDTSGGEARSRARND